MLPLLFQAVTLLPTAVDAPPPSLEYLHQVQQWATAESWSLEQREQGRPVDAQQESALIRLLHSGEDAEVRLAAVLGAGALPGSPLAAAYWRRAALDFDEARSLACLLAPASPDLEHQPLLAWIAVDSDRSLPVRAAAVARLLEAGQVQAWPLARRMLLSGTSLDVEDSTADWSRSGRYELPKRLLVLSLERLFLRRCGESARDRGLELEPNAAWQDQVAAVERWQQWFDRQPRAEWETPPQALHTLQEMEGRQKPQAVTALALLPKPEPAQAGSH